MSYTNEAALQRAQAAGALTAANYNTDIIRALTAIGGGHQILGADCDTSDATGYGANSATQYTVTLPEPSNSSTGSAYLDTDKVGGVLFEFIQCVSIQRWRDYYLF